MKFQVGKRSYRQSEEKDDQRMTTELQQRMNVNGFNRDDGKVHEGEKVHSLFLSWLFGILAFVPWQQRVESRSKAVCFCPRIVVHNSRLVHGKKAPPKNINMVATLFFFCPTIPFIHSFIHSSGQQPTPSSFVLYTPTLLVILLLPSSTSP